MLRTFNAIEQRVANLIASWASWVNPDADDGPYSHDKPMTFGEVAAKATQGTAFLRKAKDIKESPDYASLSDNHKADIDEMISELETHEAEVAFFTDPEKIWSLLPMSEKARLMHGTLAHHNVRKHLNARVKLKKTGAPKLDAAAVLESMSRQ